MHTTSIICIFIAFGKVDDIDIITKNKNVEFKENLVEFDLESRNHK